jgi:hypothetical protein
MIERECLRSNIVTTNKYHRYHHQQQSCKVNACALFYRPYPNVYYFVSIKLTPYLYTFQKCFQACPNDPDHYTSPSCTQTFQGCVDARRTAIPAMSG